MHRPDARRLGRQAFTFFLVVGALWGFWEAFRVLGEASVLRIGQFHPDDRTMPHIHDMTIIGELPSSIQGGLGGAILNFNQPGWASS